MRNQDDSQMNAATYIQRGKRRCAYLKRAYKVEMYEYKNAIENFEKAIEIEPDNYEPYYWLYYIKYIMREGEEEYLKVIELTTEILNNNPNDANAFLYRGKAQKLHYNQFAAFKDFSKAIEINPNLVEAYKCRADVAKEISYWDDTPTSLMGNYTRIIELEPNNHKAYYKRGNIKFSQNDFLGAINDFTKAIENYVFKWYNRNCFCYSYLYYSKRSSAKFELSDIDGAMNDIVKAVELSPKNDDYFIHLSHIFNDNKKYIKYEYINNNATELTEENADGSKSYKLSLTVNMSPIKQNRNHVKDKNAATNNNDCKMFIDDTLYSSLNLEHFVGINNL